ncbi:MAG: tetratricopeptide repeat protein, partial [Rhodospirillaceae bacterium]
QTRMGCIDAHVSLPKTLCKEGMEAAQRGDFATAHRLLRPVAEQGDALAQYSLGLMYSNGDGASQDYKEAAKWYFLVAQQGVVPAQGNLASMFMSGKGVDQDYKQALFLIKLAASNGHQGCASLLNLVAMQFPKEMRSDDSLLIAGLQMTNTVGFTIAVPTK